MEFHAEEDGVEVLWSDLPREALMGLLSSFVMREGTDYGVVEYSHEEKVAQLLSALQSGELRLLFDPATESFNLSPKE